MEVIKDSRSILKACGCEEKGTPRGLAEHQKDTVVINQEGQAQCRAGLGGWGKTIAPSEDV